MIINEFDNEYLKLCNAVLDTGYMEHNERTGKNCLKIHGYMMKFDLSSNKFPLLTLRKMYTDGIFAEQIGFIKGVDNAKDFRDLGCNFWDKNANVSKHWLENPNRKGEDDLGRIYGVQARQWEYFPVEGCFGDMLDIDQLKDVVDKISNGVDDRRLIVTHWNPGELNKMALPPCHMFYQFGLRGDILDLMMYQRSADLPLGVPSNIASYALLLRLIAQITNKKAGVFTHMLGNCHFYEDQLEGAHELVARPSFEAPTLSINPDIKSLKDLETWVTLKDFSINNYTSGKSIKFPFSE